jgi:Fic family protein
MKPSEFESSQFGVVRDDPDGLWWFDPHPLPRQLELEDETQIALSKADAALGRLDGVARLLRNPDLLARPYAAREAVASSQIEGTHATLSEVYEAEAGRARVYLDDVAAIESYTAALKEGMALVKERGVDLDVLCRVHDRLLHDGRHASHAGTWRDSMVWLGAPTGGPETATFVPPPARCLQQLLADWQEWHDRPPRLPLLVQIAMLHYQFLTIHPFFDGNGRVGRMLIGLILQEEGVLSSPLLYVSAFFARHRREYYDRLQAVRQRGELQQWLQYFLTGVKIQANDGVVCALRLLDLREAYRAELSGNRSRAAEVVDMLFVNPVVSAAQVQKKLRVSNQGALNLLRALERRHWLQGVGIHGRGATNFWYARELLDILEGEASEVTSDA